MFEMGASLMVALVPVSNVLLPARSEIVRVEVPSRSSHGTRSSIDFIVRGPGGTIRGENLSASPGGLPSRARLLHSDRTKAGDQVSRPQVTVAHDVLPAVSVDQVCAPRRSRRPRPRQRARTVAGDLRTECRSPCRMLGKSMDRRAERG